MDTADAADSGAMTSSTDSDSDSVVSVIRSQSPPPQNSHPNVFTFPVPRTVAAGSYVVAACVYVLIDEGKSMSADMRVMWYLKRLGSLQTVDSEFDTDESSEPCRVLSFIAREPNAEDNPFNMSIFVMDAITRVYFLTPVNNMVFCLDMSPSNVSVDIQRGHVMLDEMTLALSQSIEGFIRPFIVPGSKDILFEPQVYVTVIVHTPFYTSLAQQVLVQGWLINKQNFNEFITTITIEMNRLENALASTLSNRKTQKCNKGGSENPGVPNCSHHSNKSDENVSSIGNSNPDSGFINTLRYGMLAVRLLPRSSISNLIVITDGMITLADIQVLDSVLNQLRCIGVACSFLHVSSQFHPHSGHGHVPYSELMQLIAAATSGTYLNSFPETTDDLVVNYYHDKFIMWSFKRGNGNESPNNTKNLSCTPTRVRSGEWTVRNSNFYGNRQTQLVSKKQISDHVQAHLDNIVCCRMREGFIIEDIQFKDTGNTSTILNLTNSSKLQLKFILPWTNHIYIEYDLVVKWPPVLIKSEPMVIKETTEIQVPSTPTSQPTPSQSPDNCLNIHYSVVVKGPYEFLHDITCNRNKKTQLQLQSSQKCQFQLSSCRSSSISVTAATTTITKNMDLLPDEPSNNTPRIVSSKYRQALIARFWSTMRSIVQTDLLIKHLETYSPSTGYLIDYNNSSLSRKQIENHNLQQSQKIESPLIQQIDNSSPNILNFISASKLLDITIGVTESKTTNFSTAGIPNRSPLRSGMPLFYHLPTNSNSFSIKQCQVKLNTQQQSYTDQQHQQFADFWKPVCSLDPDSQWPKWFSTYRIGGGVLLLRHDRPLPRWLHIANIDNGRYQTLTCRKADESLFALLKQWCTFVLIDDHSYVKCLDRSDTHSGNVSFCIAQVSPRPPSCCCVVLHLGFQSCVPASVHYKIIDELKNNIQLLDSTTAVKQPLHYVDNNELSATTSSDKKRNRKKKVKKKELILKKKFKEPQRYVYFLEKPLEKILIRYEKIPTQFTTVIFPDGSQPYPVPAIKTSNKINLNSKPNSGKQNDTSQKSSRVESKTVTTTTTLSRYLYHRRWIWSSGCSRYSKCNSNASQKLLLQLARTLSILTKIRLREGFKFAHSSSGIINMVLQVDMIEGSSSSCPSTPTSHCVIQYVLFPPNIFNKHPPKDSQYANTVDMLKKKNNDDERRSSTSSIEDKQKSVVSLDAFKSSCCSQYNNEDDYQLITECWIEPQHGSVVANKNNKYMSGLMYEQLADAIWQVDSDCISSLFTFQHMQHMCIDSNITVCNPDFDLDNNQQNKAVIVDDGRIYKLPFTFNLVNLLPKCRHYSSRTYSLFTVPDDTDTKLNSTKDEKKLNNMLERSFYSRLHVLNDRLFDVNDQNKSADVNPAVTKLMNDQDIGQCFIKRVNDTRLILTVTPPFVEERYNTSDNTSDDNLEPLGRSRANTWHYTKRVVGQSLSSCTQPQENSAHYYRTMSVGSKPYFSNTTDNISWTHLRPESNLLFTQNSLSDIDSDKQDTPTNMFIEVYDCRQEDVENILMSDGHSFDHTVINDYIDDSNSCSSISSNSENDGEENVYVSNKKKIVFDQPVDPLLLDKYFHKIQDVYDRSLVTTVFHALHLGLNVQYLDIQQAVDRCHHRLITFDITDFLMVVCDHFKNNDNCMICPADNKTLKAHHDMIHTTFSSTLDRHLLKPVPNHPYYYFYDFIDKLEYDDDLQENNYMNKLTSNSCKKKYFTAILGKIFNKTNSDSYEIDEQDLFPLFIHLVCTVKTNKITKSKSVRSLPTCILELMNHDDNTEPIKNEDFKDLKISLDIYCLMLPNNDIDNDDDEENDRHNKTNSPEQLHLTITTKSTTVQSTKQFEDYETPFTYLSSSLPVRHAQGLAAFITEVEWSMRDEMAAGLLKEKDLTATPDTLEKIIEHVTNSPYSLSNEHEKIAVHFVAASPGTSKYNSDSLFLQKLDQLDIIIDVDNDDGIYTLVQCINNIFYVVKKNMLCSRSDNTVSESTNMNYDLKTVLPNFWLILKVESDQLCQKEYSDNNSTINTLIVNVYFHCRFTELDVQGRYSMIREVVGQNVRQAAITVNQILLLNRLYETKSCDSLLEPIIEDLIYSDDDENSNSNNEMEKVINHFSLGQFRCPVVWNTRFALHPRLRHTSNILLHGVQVLHNVLEKFSVRNRRNMFVYKESSGSVYYLRLYENSSPQQNQKNNVGYILQGDTDDEDSISRCSSATSTTVTVLSSLVPSTYSNPLQLRKFSEDLINTESKCTQTPGARSIGSHWGDTDSKDVEELILKVHGISQAGNEICIDLVEVLQNRLNDAVLEVLTTMIHRNPMCKLYPDDVYYVQPCDGHPDITMNLLLPNETKITKSFNHNLKRSASALLLFPPKYLSRHHKFNYKYDTIDNSDKPIIRSFFIYNQPGGLTSANGGMRGMSGNKGIACILYDIYSNKNNDSIYNMYAYPTNPELFEKRIQTICIGDNVKSIAGYSGYIKLYVWLRGRIPIDILQITLTSIVTHSLWDVYMVHFLKKQPIIIEEPHEIYVNPLCIQYLTKWIAFGSRISVPLSHHSQIQCRLHINHVLREFKTHLSWFGTSVSKSLCVSVRYFYIPRMEYGESADISNNVICGSSDPLKLEQKQDNSLINNLVFYEWQISNNNSTICPPSAACVLIIVSMSAPKNHKNQNRDNELSDSDTDNGMNILDDYENTNSEESNETLIINNKTSTNDQSMTYNNNSNDSLKKSSENNNKDDKKQHTKNTFSNKNSKLLLLCVSGQSVHTLSYNFRKNDDQPVAIDRLSRWLEWRQNAFTLSIYDMMGLKNSQINDIFNGTGNKNTGINNNLDLLLDYKGYATTVSEHELYDKVAIEKNSRLNTRTKSIDDADDKKYKSLQYEKDEHDLFIEQLVRNRKQQRRIEIYYKLIYDMWIQKDANVTKDTLRAFFQQSRLLHYCLTPLLFLPSWRLESAATRDHLVNAVKTKSSIPSPQWHKRLCARLTSAFADYVQTNPLFTGFQLVQITKQRAFNDSGAVEMEQTKPTACYFKKSIHGATGGLLLLETGVCQPFYYVKLYCIERSRLTNQVEYYEDKFKPQYSILDHSENIVKNMHLHSFTYDFHVRVLSDRLNNLVKKQKKVKRNINCRDLSMLLEHRNSVQINENKSESSSKKNAIAGFLDDFLMYYNQPPLYSSCLVLSGVIKRTQISVTGLQLYEYLLENCSENYDGMAVIKICDSALVDGDDGASLFDDDDNDEADGQFMESQCSVGNDLTDFILVHHMAGSDIQQRQESEMNSNSCKLGIEANELHANCLFDVCGLYDATLVMTLSSVKKLLLDTSNEITLSYYMLLTNNENCNSDKKEITSCNKANCNMQQRHSTPIRPSVHGFDQTNNLLVSSSVPNNSFSNVMNIDTSNCWGSLDENNSNNWSQIHTPLNHSPHLKKKRRKCHNYFDDDVNNHHQQTAKKTNLIKFYEKKAAELVAHTVDTASNRCRLHLLWKKFSIQSDQQKLGSTAITTGELKELVNKSAFLKPLSIYDRNLGPLVDELCKGPQWFTSLHKLINGQSSLTSSPTLSVQCCIYNSNISEHQYLVLSPNWLNDREINSFIIIDNGAVETEIIADNSDSLINIVFRSNVIGSEEVNILVETVAKSICFHIWRAVVSSSATLTVSDP